MNEIFILRHGKAEEAIETKSKNDFDRKLTIEGQKRTKKLGLFFNSLEESIDLVYPQLPWLPLVREGGRVIV